MEGPFMECVVNGDRVKMKYCRTCWILRPPRSSHCPDCDLCVERLITTALGSICIGKYNYMRFLGFIYTTCLLELFNLGCCLAHNGMIAAVVKSNGNSIEMLETAGSSIFIGFIF